MKSSSLFVVEIMKMSSKKAPPYTVYICFYSGSILQLFHEKFLHMLGHYIFDPHNRSYVLCIVFVIKPRGRLPELGNPKSGRGRLRERFITKFKSQIERGFTKGGRN